MNSSRQLAAIMFTDIVGYTALMGKDSAKALELVDKSKDIQKPLVEKHNGQWLKEMGDGALARFNSALDAVSCAVEIQEVARGKLDGKLRIGIHLGDVTIKEDDVYGDGVNVASRLESIADPGGIYISESIEKAIRGQSKVQAKLLGEIKLKNVDYDVKTYAVQGVGLPVPEIKEDQHLKGHLWAEVQRRGVVRAGATYVVLALLAVLLLPYAESVVNLPQWSTTALLGILIVGLPIAMYFAWNFERSPEGFVRTTSRQSWQNPYSAGQRKPLTNNFFVLGIALTMILMYVYTRYLTKPGERSGTDTAIEINDKSIAVLPFSDMSATGDQEYLGDGIAEEIINSLTKIQDLKVIGRTSSFSFKGQNIDLREIGQKLDVGTLLEGSVQKAGDQLRITAQLINAADGSHIWSERYDRELNDIFDIQDDIAERIAQKFELTLSLHTSDSPPTRNLDAYELYLKGLQKVGLGHGGVETAVEFFEQALQLDPQFVSSYAELAFANWLIGFYGLGERAKHYSLARKMALRAIELAPNSYTGYIQLGLLDMLVDWNWKASEENFQKAMDLGLPLPNYYQVAYKLWIYGVDDALIKEAQILVEKDPLSSATQGNLTRILLYGRRFQETVRQGEEFLKSNPESTSIMRHVGEGHWFSGNPELALPYFEKLVKKEPTYVPYDYIGTLIALGREKEARTFFDQQRDSIMLGRLALCYIHLGELDNAFATIEQAYLDGDPYLIFIKWDMHWDPVREDPRYQAMLKKMNFPE